MTPIVPGRFRAVLFDAGNTLVRMNYPAIARHLAGRGHAVVVDAIEEAELHARVRLDANLARGVSSEGRTAQDLYLVYLLEGEGIETGLDLDALIATSEWMAEQLGRPLEGLLYRAGRFP